MAVMYVASETLAFTEGRYSAVTLFDKLIVYNRGLQFLIFLDVCLLSHVAHSIATWTVHIRATSRYLISSSLRLAVDMRLPCRGLLSKCSLRYLICAAFRAISPRDEHS